MRTRIIKTTLWTWRGWPYLAHVARPDRANPPVAGDGREVRVIGGRS